MQNSYQQPALNTFRLVDDSWHRQSIANTFANWDNSNDVWVFGYGSLIWRPEFEYIESHIANVKGYHRSLCLWSRVNRGTPESPGLVFGLDAGGQCQGKVYKLAKDNLETTMLNLWRREMPSASYIPSWLDCYTDIGHVKALAFTMNQADSSYAPNLSIDQTIDIVRQGHGKYGACTDYVLETAKALESVGISDQKLFAIAKGLTQHYESC